LPGAAGTGAGFVAKLTPDGSELVYATYFGGKSGSGISGIAVDAQGSVYLTGSTAESDFPTRNPLQRSLAGGSDVFVTKLDAAGSSLVYSTYLGGPRNEGATAIAVDSAGRAIITGRTQGGFPVVRALQTVFGGGDEINGDAYDAFVACLNPAGTALEYA